jgi:hypothetical protein
MRIVTVRCPLVVKFESWNTASAVEHSGPTLARARTTAVEGRRQLLERTSVGSTDVIAHVFPNAITAQLGATDSHANKNAKSQTIAVSMEWIC